MRRTLRCLKVSGGVGDFVDTAYLRNQRPKVPGGAWAEEHLAGKSIADLQLIWFSLLRERNMLLTMKEHYMRHTEELGAMPAPSRLKMIGDSMRRLRKVMAARDQKAADEAEELFNERLSKGIYSPVPGPAPPADYGMRDSVSQVKVTLSKYVDESRLRELLGRFDVFEDHRGIAEISVEPTPETAAKKEAAETAWEEWYWAANDAQEYAAVSGHTSFFDECVDVELAPQEHLEDTVVAGSLTVPTPLEDAGPGKSALERIRHADRTFIERQPMQLGYFPNVTSERPAEPGPRPPHPDEIEGPYQCTIVYSSPGGKNYLDALELTRIDGADVLSIEDATDAYIEANAASTSTPEYADALGQEKARVEHLKNWPHVPKWKPEYAKLAIGEYEEIVQYNFNNVSDYVDREALLTSQSVWENPVTIDPSCGKGERIPPHAEPPVELIPKQPFDREEY